MTSRVVPAPRTPVDQSAWDLVAAAQQGDRAAVGELYERYVDAVFRFVLCRTADRALAEDLTSETFLRALRRIDSVSNTRGRDVGAWFVTIARNLILDHVKSSRYRLELTTADMLDAGTAPGPDGEVITREVQAVVQAGVAKLNDVQREVVTLRYLQGLTIEETATALGVDRVVVKARAHRGVRKLAGMASVQRLGSGL